MWLVMLLCHSTVCVCGEGAIHVAGDAAMSLHSLCVWCWGHPCGWCCCYVPPKSACVVKWPSMWLVMLLYPSTVCVWGEGAIHVAGHAAMSLHSLCVW